MRWLPREHGATVIWLASAVLGLLALPQVPPALGMIIYACGCLGALLLLAWITGRSAVLVRMERNPAMTPILSAPLTLLVPFGHVVMLGSLTPGAVALWLLFLVFTITGVVYTGDAVRALLRGARPGWGRLVASAVLVGAAELVLSAAAWLPVPCIAILVPLLVHRFTAGSPTALAHLSKAERIRRVGFAQAANLLAAASILAVAVHL